VVRFLATDPEVRVRFQALPDSYRLCGLVVRFLATDPEVLVRFPALPDSYLLCGLVVRFLATDPEVRVRFPALPPLWPSGQVPGYRCRGPGSIPGASRFSEKQRVWNRVHSVWVQLRLCLKEIVAAPVWKADNTAVGIGCADHATHVSAKVDTNFADKRRSLAD
jgi:hypothetical protein